ncbi:hypothetical protein MPH_07186 [Macrophomina phaseolina MS6]|uniref:Uncharacterized protein n=1 Tax=Macrophomina phaseolina (strain MS6) TaxID=1126212 RepID=K2R0I0_MACPH|nr:hypothetical protein MPH_07186 [Macrophomina phaseolina MS6]
MLRLTEPTVAARTLRRYYRTNFTECRLTGADEYGQNCGLDATSAKWNDTNLALNKPLPPLPKRRSSLSRPPTLSSALSPSMAGWLMHTNVSTSPPSFSPDESSLLGYYKVPQQGSGERRRKKARERKGWTARMKRMGKRILVGIGIRHNFRCEARGQDNG